MKPERKPERAVKLNVIQPQSVLNRSGMGGFTLNPYVGCPVGCAYCYVPHMKHKQLEERTWGTYVDVKEGVPELLDKQLRRLRQPTRVLSHFLLMVVYALLVSVFFTALWRRERREQAVLFLQLFLGMVGGGLLAAWLMYPFPAGPPAPIP